MTPERLTPERLAEIRAACEAATPGPWEADLSPGSDPDEGYPNHGPDTRFRGVEFIDKNLHLNPGPRSAGDSCGTVCMVFTNGPWKGWICYRHPDGQWVSRREADKEDLLALLDRLAHEI